MTDMPTSGRAASRLTGDKRFSVYVDGIFDLRVEDIWPDGNAPENPTAEDAAEVMRRCGSWNLVLGDWCLQPRVEVSAGSGPAVTVWKVWP